MKKIITALIYLFIRTLLWFRYKIEFKGLDKINSASMNKPGGVLFLPNHPAVFVDPLSAGLGAWKKRPIRPMVVEYMYYHPLAHWLFKYVNAIPVPDFASTSNSVKVKRTEKVFNQMVDGLEKGDSFMIYPAGKTKSSNKEVIGGASGLHRILSERPDTNIVLVRIKGLWGSRFSRYWTGRAAQMGPVLGWGIKQVLKNLIFFTPRRKIIIEYLPAPADFPRRGTRLEVNRYLENWYNQPDGLTKQEGSSPGDSLILLPYSMWSREVPKAERTAKQEFSVDLDKIPHDVQGEVREKLAELAEIPPEKVKPDMTVASDLGLDSLDVAEIIAFLTEKYDVKNIPVEEVTTVAKVMALAAGQLQTEDNEIEAVFDLKKWNRPIKREKAAILPGSNIGEVFLNACDKFGSRMVMADDRLGPIDYKTLKLRTIILANEIKKMEGDKIGVLLPASVAAFMVIMACELVGKVPVMINWTQGPRHLEQVKELANLKTVVSSWAFIDRLEGIDFNGLDDIIVMLEDIRRKVTLKDKLRGKFLSRKSVKTILNKLNPKGVKPEDPAVILFTSGTENMPKGVPLSHVNILSNMRPVFDDVPIYTDDILFGILPPFHSFGFTVATLLPPLAGARVAFFPNPTEGKKMAERCKKWGVTITCGAPTFLKGIMKGGTKEMFKTIRLNVTGAEKAPQELFDMVSALTPGEIIEGYGITECAPVLTMNRPGKFHKGVGQPLRNVELMIVHPETFEKLPPNTQGLILAKGPNVFSGYINPGIEPPFAMIEGEKWYKTGDLGNLDEEGYLTISGRLKRFIKIGGEMVSLGAVEEALLKAGASRGWKFAEDAPSLAIMAKEHAGEKTRISLFTVFKTDVEEVNSALKEAGFSNLVRISQVNVIKEIPIMGTGKVNYRGLEKL
ncbi:MAG: AMP-binding protein [Parachlamydiaceae bacterium]